MKSIKLFLAVLLVTIISTRTFAKDPGDTVNDFTVKNFDGKEYKLSAALENGYVVVMFWSAECPYVQPFNDRINDYINSYNGKGITFWAINSNVTESTERVKEHSMEHKYVFPVLKDDNSVVANLFEATRTPEVFVLNKDRKIMYHGRIDDNSYAEKVSTHDLQNALDELIAGKEITTKTTKSFGCAIKRN